MKKSGFALALLGALAGGASAQSSVTLFGVVDNAARSTKNGSAGTLTSLASGGLFTSRFGFRGKEDLGGGMTANFWLESGINSDTGAPGDGTRLFNRASWVSLGSPFGELRLGRDLNPTYVNTFQYDPFVAVGVGTVLSFTSGPSALLGSGIQTNQRNDNSIGYFLPKTLGGVYGSFMASAGEGTPGKKYVGGRLGYAVGSFDIAIAYGETETAVGDDYTQTGIAGSYKFGPARLMGFYNVVEFGALEQETFLIGTNVVFGSHRLRASFAVNRLSGGAAGSGFADGDDSRLIALGYVYGFSNRTNVYATASRITNDGSARSVVSATPAGMLAGENSTGYEIGLSHSF